VDVVELHRIGVVPHPSREVARAVETVRAWAERHGATLSQPDAPGVTQRAAPPCEPEGCDLVIAIGGDGTTLAALRVAAPAGRPVLGVACGSLGALTAVDASRVERALDRVAGGDWTPRRLPAVVVERDGRSALRGLNDLVVVRAGGGQVSVEIVVDGERVIRYGGDGVVAATPLGSTAYTLAAGGPMLAPGADGLVLTPLAPHGGVCPPIVVAPESAIAIGLDPGYGGARLEVDGRVEDALERLERVELSVSYEPGYATLIALDDHESLIAGLRRRRILIDSPRVLARDEREGVGRGTSAGDEREGVGRGTSAGDEREGVGRGTSAGDEREGRPPG
jgi:NAD+ kinase